eukprot:1606020-Pyramimonas_sp.AAC.1
MGTNSQDWTKMRKQREHEKRITNNSITTTTPERATTNDRYMLHLTRFALLPAYQPSRTKVLGATRHCSLLCRSCFRAA